MPRLLRSRPIEGAEHAPRQPAAITAPPRAPAARTAVRETPLTPSTEADGLSRLLRRAVLDRADTRLLQRYELVQETAGGVAGASEYRVLGAAAVEFEAQSVTR
jgi:hypothetical protein